MTKKFQTIDQPKKAIIVSDIHGYFSAINKITKLKEFDDENYQLILLGDFTDGIFDDSRNPKKVIDFVVNLVEEHNALLVHGNHDDMFLKTAQKDRNYFNNWSFNGMALTLKKLGFENDVDDLDQVADFLNKNFSTYLEILDSAPYAIEDEHRIFVHAGLNWADLDYHQTESVELTWLREPYIFQDSTAQLGKTIFTIDGISPFAHENLTNKVIFSGHTPTFFLTGDLKNKVTSLQNNENDIKRYFIDGGAHGKVDAGLNVVIVDIDGNILREEKLFG